MAGELQFETIAATDGQQGYLVVGLDGDGQVWTMVLGDDGWQKVPMKEKGTTASNDTI